MKKTVLFLMIAFASIGSYAQNSEVFSNDEGAIKGYDPVAYFKEGKPVKGNTNYVYRWREADWHFSKKENLDAFKSAPEKFAPQYGGYCAYGTSQGYKAETAPDAWTVANGKLYLNYNTEVKTMWTKDQKAFIEKADANWPKIKSKEQ